MHISLSIFKLRHICVFSINKLMESNKNLVFLGMMGSGKTTLGKIISKKLNKEFIDVDQVIEVQEGMVNMSPELISCKYFMMTLQQIE